MLSLKTISNTEVMGFFSTDSLFHLRTLHVNYRYHYLYVHVLHLFHVKLKT